MKTDLLFDFVVNKETNSIIVKREFAAALEQVWKAWTTADILDQWWAPKPWKTQTKSMDFRSGGTWLYSMVGPENEVHWCRADYKHIENHKGYSGLDAFCDQDGKVNEKMARSEWEVQFEATGSSTIVTITVRFKALEDLETYIQMGFKEGFTAALENLDALFAS